MSDEQSKRFSRLRNAASATSTLASAWTSAKTAKLQYRTHQLQTQLESPDSWIEAGGTDNPSDRFTTRKAQRNQLSEYHDIRLDGGIVATLLEARALMVFGVGGEYTAENDEVAEWLNDQFDQLDLLTFDIGADALFYGYSLGEIRETVNGEFGKVEFIEPWTTVPKVSNKGEILSWEQNINQRHGANHEQEFDPDEILHFSVMKASGRDPVGMSMLGRAMDEAIAYRDNQEAIQNAVTLHGFPKWHVKLGREDGAVIDDNELRRARPKFDNIDELTKWITGQDVEIETISPEGFEFENITEHDLSKLAIAFMLPVELTQLGGGDGLGTGFPARLRERLFLLSAQAQQNQLSGELVDQLGRRLIIEYSPYEESVIEEADVDFVFEPPITDVEELERKVNAVGEDMTVNERRDLFDLPAVEDEEIGEQYDPPGRTDQPFGEDGGQGGDDINAPGENEPDEPTDPMESIGEELAAYREGFDSIVWGEFDAEHDLASPVFGNDDDVPANVRSRLERAADQVRWSDTEGVPPGNLRDFFVNKLSQPQGWSIDSLANGLRTEFGARLGEPDERVNIARTKSAALLNQAKRMAFADLQQGIEGELRYYWDGPQDDSTTDACEELKRLTNPDFGGEPRPVQEFNELQEEIRQDHFPEFETRGDAIHWQERHAIEAQLPSQADVNPAGVGGMATAAGDD